jgi:3-oxoacyl-[acyl-carrier-protein] synthase-3
MLVSGASQTALVIGAEIMSRHVDPRDLYVYHQANTRILANLAERLELDPGKVVDAIATVGNTSAASVPLALEQARADGRLSSGMRVLLAAVGSGFTWGASVVEWGMR